MGSPKKLSTNLPIAIGMLLFSLVLPLQHAHAIRYAFDFNLVNDFLPPGNARQSNHAGWHTTGGELEWAITNNPNNNLLTVIVDYSDPNNPIAERITFTNYQANLFTGDRASNTFEGLVGLSLEMDLRGTNTIVETTNDAFETGNIALEVQQTFQNAGTISRHDVDGTFLQSSIEASLSPEAGCSFCIQKTNDPSVPGIIPGIGNTVMPYISGWFLPIDFPLAATHQHFDINGYASFRGSRLLGGTEVPEPLTSVLLASGLLGGLLQRKKAHQ